MTRIVVKIEDCAGTSNVESGLENVGSADLNLIPPYNEVPVDWPIRFSVFVIHY